MNYPKTEDYYNLFNDKVQLFYANETGTASSGTSKSIKDDFFNDDTANDVHKVDTIDEEYYEYLCIKPTALVTVQDLSLFVKSLETLKFEVRIYLVDVLPLTTGIRAFGMKKAGPDGKDISYMDNYSNPIQTVQTAAKQNIWQSIYSNRWNVDGAEKRYIDVGVSKYIVVQFLNNTGYGVDLGYTPVKFSIVNLMISPKNEKYAVTTN